MRCPSRGETDHDVGLQRRLAELLGVSPSSFLSGYLDTELAQRLAAVFLVIGHAAAEALGGDGGGFVVGWT